MVVRVGVLHVEGPRERLDQFEIEILQIVVEGEVFEGLDQKGCELGLAHLA